MSVKYRFKYEGFDFHSIHVRFETTDEVELKGNCVVVELKGIVII